MIRNTIWEFTGNEYGFKSGTSMATPVLAGIADLAWSANPGLNSLEVKQIIMDSVDQTSDFSGKLISCGRINAAAAVMSALSFSEPDPGDDPDNDPEVETSDSGIFFQ